MVGLDTNYSVLLIFAPLLIFTGILGFVLPPQKSPASGAPAYNVFHIVFGLIGLSMVLAKNDSGIRTFNIVFGLIDFFQAAASFLHWFPEKHFRWKPLDDILHILIGAALVLVGIFG